MSTMIVLLLLLGPQVALADEIGTLKTYQRAAYDEETIMLKCPPGTTVAVVLARYGRNGTGNGTYDDSCALPKLMQDTLLQTVVGVCYKKRQCKVNTSPKAFEDDPCPGYPTFVEVAYKCRANDFRYMVVCENEVMNLSCDPGQRVAIIRAFFGGSEYESLQCPQPHGLKNEPCAASYATETVMQMCHGKRKCSIVANSTTFNDPCRPDITTYLKVAYTCVSRSVLQKKYQGDLEPDEINLTQRFDEGFDRVDFGAEFSPSPNLEGPQPQPRDNVSRNFPTVSSSPPRARTNSDVDGALSRLDSVDNKAKTTKEFSLSTVVTTGIMWGDGRDGNSRDLPTGTMQPPNCTTVVYAIPEEDRVVVGYLNEWINAYSFISNNQEKFYLYVIMSVTVGVLLLLGLVIGCLLISRHRAKRDAKFHANNEALPNGFTDDISEVDANIDLTTPVPVPMQDIRIPETQLVERLHGERYYTNARIPLSPTSIHATPSHHHQVNTGMRVDLGNHMVGTDSLHTIPRGLSPQSYYYG